MKPKVMWNHNRIGEESCSSLLSVPGRAGAFSRDFTTSLAPECRAFSGALKIEKLKPPLTVFTKVANTLQDIRLDRV